MISHFSSRILVKTILCTWFRHYSHVSSLPVSTSWKNTSGIILSDLGRSLANLFPHHHSRGTIRIERLGAITDMLSLIWLLTVFQSFRSHACMNSVTISFALLTDSFFCMAFLRNQQIYLLVTCRFRFREFLIQDV
jgi:hypothetical protein